ncbi:MerR family transcriptional regulator [Salinimicrobium marinum]|uniref:MerR family transcriptional regulator n=1 Tax=Salinimicrobium marinum TaxID=680283 RepID=A0A918SHD8_9FLAO|nr:MerR family transcriptional regulator [Salinimicrobium marinum]GHA42373.1 MerR family transcriptional regulator [Salinimicrobium marinum]
MNQFSISQLSQFSGIKAHTIRIWEQRYNALQPNRSEGNTRYYDAKQLRRLLNIVSLTEAGYKISQLGAMEDEQLFSLIAELEEKERGSELAEVYISQLIAAAMDFNEVHFEKTFSHCLLKYGIRDAYLLVIYPLLKRLGFFWASNTIPPAREHFISNIIRQKLFTAIDALPPEGNKGESWLLFLPENEFHEIGLLFANYLIRSSGRKVFYLGANLPVTSLIDAVKEVSPSKLLIFLVHYDHPEIAQQYIKDLESLLPKQEIYLSGNMKLLGQLDLGKRTHKIGAVAELEKELEFMISNESVN